MKKVVECPKQEASQARDNPSSSNSCIPITEIMNGASMEHSSELPHTNFPKEKLKTCLALMFFIMAMFVTTLTLSLVHERVPDRDKCKALSDVVLDNIGHEWIWGLYISEVLLVISLLATSVVIVLHKHRFILMRRLFLIGGVLFLMRAITIYVTVLPLSNETYSCAPKANVTSVGMILKRSLYLLSGFGLSVNGFHIYCGDYVYSGHTVCLVLFYLTIQEYTPRYCWLLHWLTGLVVFVGVSLLLVAKSHYTLDIIIAYYVTSRIFWIYHTLANNPHLKQKGPDNFLCRIWWFPIFCYFERNVHGMVPCELEWPPMSCKVSQ